MIRVPSITIVRPWPAALRRRRTARPDWTPDEAAKELARRRMAATVAAERDASFSALFTGRKLI